MRVLLNIFDRVSFSVSEKVYGIKADINGLLWNFFADLELMLNEKQRYTCCYFYIHKMIGAIPNSFQHLDLLKLGLSDLALISMKGSEGVNVMQYNTTARRIYDAFCIAEDALETYGDELHQEYFDAVSELHMLGALYQAMSGECEFSDDPDVIQICPLPLGGGLVVSSLMHCWNALYPGGYNTDISDEVIVADLTMLIKQIFVLLRVKLGFYRSLPVIP